MSPDFIAIGMIWYIVFLFSTTCHEGAHSLVARIGGDPTAFHGGQASLNPIPHIRRAPFGMVVVPILTYILPPHWMFGWASAPYDPNWERQYPRRAAWMALAGPAANFTLAILAAIAIRTGIAVGYFQIPDSISFTHIVAAAVPGRAEFFATFLSVLFVLNVLLGTFNLLPVPPLDGHSGVTLLMSRTAALRFIDWTRGQGFGMLGLVLAWVLYDRIFGYIISICLAALYPGTRWG
ncbi:MAG TPA: site-2 protease family protein [Candidatus Acidoferrales bacterium]|nr:site-2 protease family protein [Candidatus Acidoferrales bacterium]